MYKMDRCFPCGVMTHARNTPLTLLCQCSAPILGGLFLFRGRKVALTPWGECQLLVFWLMNGMKTTKLEEWRPNILNLWTHWTAVKCLGSPILLHLSCSHCPASFSILTVLQGAQGCVRGLVLACPVWSLDRCSCQAAGLSRIWGIRASALPLDILPSPHQQRAPEHSAQCKTSS